MHGTAYAITKAQGYKIQSCHFRACDFGTACSFSASMRAHRVVRLAD